MSVLIHRRRDLAEAQLTALAERRKEIAGNLQRLHDAITPLTEGKAATPYMMDKLLTAGNHADDTERAAVRLWLDYSGYQDLPVRDSALTTAFFYPKELTALIEVANDCYPVSEDPKRYGKDEFTPPPITPDERAAIMERAEVRAATDADAELYRSAERLVNLANARNQSAGANIVSLADLTTGANIMFSGLVKVKPAGPHPLDEPTFIVDDSGLNMVRTNYRAFDE
ncbi:hypothetical protein [Neolewinella agarilytica]|uniref:Uncharacterized protein n=1 Tax=Neolewinella agarilytica TaxID=478744 RepID=A0A1H9D3H7_9BACT|nr:hypothetical protein [Neolewinella agarilytica]SEQ07907.1 hypothetical protein SAMN05444359_105128 [Neolewinella agarilytica]